MLRSFYRPHSRVTIDCGSEVMTKQEFKDECDIHKILKQFQKTGVIEHINKRAPAFVDLPEGLDFQGALHTVMAGEAAFAELPSQVRDEFHNSPEEFLLAFQDPSKASRLRELGLLKPKGETPAAAPEGAPPAAASPQASA